VANNIIPFLDAPAHTRPRKLLSKAFLEFTRDSSADVENLAHSMVGEFKGKGAMDILDDFATPFSVRVLSRVLGVPPQDEPQLKEWSEDFFYLFSIIPSREIRENLDSTLREFRAYFKSLVEQRRKNPENDLISVLLHTGQEGERLSESEIIDHCMLLFADGVENVDSGIANAMHALLTHPGQLALLQAKPELMAQAVEECLRFETPGQFIGRMALEDFTLNGVSIKKNTGVLLVIGAANRDPRIFDDPHSLNIMRSPNPYLSFGKGRHACIGGPLVRIEMEAALRALIGTLQGISLSGTEIHWEARLGHRWIARLPVVFSRF
jgi:cytochrome P450